jgi:hypothetical protein
MSFPKRACSESLSWRASMVRTLSVGSARWARGMTP